MKRRKLWKMAEDGLCSSSSAIQTQLGPSSLLEERSKTPIVFVVSLCCRLPPKLGETAKVYRYSKWKEFIISFITFFAILDRPWHNQPCARVQRFQGYIPGTVTTKIKVVWINIDRLITKTYPSHYKTFNQWCTVQV